LRAIRVFYLSDQWAVINEQTLVFLFNREILDASRGRPFHSRITNNRFFSKCVSLLYLSIEPPSIITAFGFPPSALAVEVLQRK